jgi:hypothetical protein
VDIAGYRVISLPVHLDIQVGYGTVLVLRRGKPSSIGGDSNLGSGHHETNSTNLHQCVYAARKPLWFAAGTLVNTVTLIPNGIFSYNCVSLVDTPRQECIV